MLSRLVRAGAAAAPDQPLVVSTAATWSYAEVLARGEALARGLLARSIGRFCCVLDDPAELIALLAAATMVGAEACVYPARLDGPGFDELAKAFDHQVVVTDRDLGSDHLEVVRPADLALEGGHLPAEPDVAPSLILTTGTTGRPKGARHDWFRLAAGVRARDDAPGARWLLAYNLNQFAGAQILLHVLTSRATLVVPETNQPRVALAAMRELGVTHASATPTFWRFAVGLLDADLAASIPLRQITLGGEATPAPLLAALHRLFPAATVSQVYASTEFGSTGSAGGDQNGLPASILDRDEDADVRVRIVDGQLEVRSRVGMLGYYGEPEADPDAWRPSGDLVERRGDRIHFVGRAIETINVGGVKVHPLPVEELVSAVDGVELVHVFGRANPVSGQIVQADVVARAGVDTDVLEDDIRAACEALPEAARPRRVRFVDAIDITDQKVVRGPGGGA